jgi:hypothetical protein
MAALTQLSPPAALSRRSAFSHGRSSRMTRRLIAGETLYVDSGYDIID